MKLTYDEFCCEVATYVLLIKEECKQLEATEVIKLKNNMLVECENRNRELAGKFIEEMFDLIIKDVYDITQGRRPVINRLPVMISCCISCCICLFFA